MEHVCVTEFGSYLGKKSERLVIRRNKEIVREIPFFKIEQLTIEGRGVSISSDLLEQLTQEGIQINFLTRGGKPYAKLTSPVLSASVDIRREQLAAFLDNRGLEIGKAIVAGKISNQINLLRYFGKYRKRQSSRAELKELIKKMRQDAALIDSGAAKIIDDYRGELLALEARVGKRYWAAVRQLIKDKYDFQSREHSGAKDAVNSALNYGYGFLYNRVWGAVLLAGLEPFAGFVHVDRPGKPSLVLDLVEEFRQPVVDRVVISLINKGSVLDVDNDGLTDDTRDKLRQAFNAEIEHARQFQGKRQKMANIIQIQARNLAAFLRGGAKYKPYVLPW